MDVISTLKSWFKAATAPAEDPRVAYADPSQKRQELLSQVRKAKAKLMASRSELEAKLVEARNRQQESFGRTAGDVFTQQLSEIVNEELRTIEGEVQTLNDEAAELGAAEQRLLVQEQAFQAREQALSARYSAAEARVRIEEDLRGVSNELANLGLAVQMAERRYEDAQARVVAIEHVAGMGEIINARGGQAPVAHVLASNYASEARIEESELLRRLLSSGFKTLLDLEYEYRQLQVLVGRRRTTDPLSFGYIGDLVEQIYAQGLSVLADALSLVQAIRTPGEAKLEQRLDDLAEEVRSLTGENTNEARATIELREETQRSLREILSMVRRQRLRAEELLHQGGQCVSTLNRSRIELAELKVAGSETNLESVTQSLAKAIEAAKAVQDELNLMQA